MNCCLTDPLTCLLAHLGTYLAACYPLTQLPVYFYTRPNLHTCLLTQSVKPANEVCCISDIKNIIHQFHVRFLAPLLNKFSLSHLYILTCLQGHVFPQSRARIFQLMTYSLTPDFHAYLPFHLCGKIYSWWKVMQQPAWTPPHTPKIHWVFASVVIHSLLSLWLLGNLLSNSLAYLMCERLPHAIVHSLA